MANPPQPQWEAIAILLTVLALLPASLSVQMDRPLIPKPLAWGVMAASLALMVFILVRRIRRVRALRPDDTDDFTGMPFPPAPPKGRP